jgi:hypothetical protein
MMVKLLAWMSANSKLLPPHARHYREKKRLDETMISKFQRNESIGHTSGAKTTSAALSLCKKWPTNLRQICFGDFAELLPSNRPTSKQQKNRRERVGGLIACQPCEACSKLRRSLGLASLVARWFLGPPVTAKISEQFLVLKQSEHAEAM